MSSRRKDLEGRQEMINGDSRRKTPASSSHGNKAGPEATVELQLMHGQFHDKLSWGAFILMSWAAIGVIFGDIATSPLYVYSSIFEELTPNSLPTQEDVLGIVSLIFWTLTLEVLIKYMGVVLMADDQGQGGTFALYSLLCRHIGIKPHGVRGSTARRYMSKGLIEAGAAAAKAVSSTARARSISGAAPLPPALRAAAASVGGAAPAVEEEEDSDSSDDEGEEAQAPQLWWQRWSVDKHRVQAFFRNSRNAQVCLWCVSVIATAMLIGDGVLTPAMSVLSAVSGLRVAVPSLGQDVVIGVTIAILALVFFLQQYGTGQIGRAFAPIIALWLVANAAINIYNLYTYGGFVFSAINPAHIVTLFANHGATAWRSLGAVMLCVTGAEALFADLGHFSRGTISSAFGVLAYPCLVITYMGQAAFVIKNPSGTDAFWASLPNKLLYPMLVLATLATVVASQALISGVFSIIRQAMILGAFPPVRVVHTGGDDPAAATQVYVPLANGALFVLCCAVVAGFQDTVALGKAYGLAVMTDMMTTTCLVTLVMLAVWGTSLVLVVPFFGLFLVVEGAYWTANIIKVPGGGWFTLAVAFVVSIIMFTWWAGSRRLGERLAAVSAGAQIRVLGREQPPPLLQPPPSLRQPSLPVPPSLASPSAPAPGDYHHPIYSPGRILSRISSWALSRSSASKVRSPFAGGEAAGSSPGAGADSGYPAAATATVVCGGNHGKYGNNDIAAASAPMPKTDDKSCKPAALDAAAGGGGGTHPHQPKLESKSSYTANPSRLSVQIPQAPSSANSGQLHKASTPGRTSVFGRGRLRARSLGGPHTPRNGQQLPPPSPSLRPPSGSGLSVLRRRYRPVPESAFAPGTLALVLPPEAPRPGRARAAAGQRPGAVPAGNVVVDPELGLPQEGKVKPPQDLIVPLKTRLAGIGIYYMDEKMGVSFDTLASLPPVLIHFLGNVQAIHEVCVFLSVRRLPIPTIPRKKRLHVYAPHSATPPNFYQVVARYGYLDIIDHGPAFISELLDSILRRLASAALRVGASGFHGSRGGLLQHMHSRGPTSCDAPGTPAEARPLGPDGDLLARLGQHSASVMMRLAAYSGASRHGASVPGGPALAPVSVAPAALQTQGSLGADEASAARGHLPLSQPAAVLPDGAEGLNKAAMAPEGALEAAGLGNGLNGDGLQHSARREAAVAARYDVEHTLATFLEAQLHGVVYYASHAIIRPDPLPGAWPLTRLAHWVVYGVLYDLLATVAYDEMDRWNVPAENLVALGMHLEL